MYHHSQLYFLSVSLFSVSSEVNVIQDCHYKFSMSYPIHVNNNNVCLIACLVFMRMRCVFSFHSDLYCRTLSNTSLWKSVDTVYITAKKTGVSKHFWFLFLTFIQKGHIRFIKDIYSVAEDYCFK